MFKNNKIYILDKNGNKKRVFFVKGLKIRFRGKDSTVIIGSPVAKFKHSKIQCGNNCTVIIGTSSHQINRLKINALGDNSNVVIGKDFSLTMNCGMMLFPEKNLSINIGDDCMFGSNVMLWATDGHTIVDLSGEKILNYGRNINIGNHVWLADRVTLLKGVNLEDGAVVGLGSVVPAGTYAGNSVLAGNLAKIVKSEINWKREPIL